MKNIEPITDGAERERRRFRRERVDLPGRLFIPAEEREARCTVVDLSPGGAKLSCEIVPDVSTSVVLYLDIFGRFEGPVARRDDNSFSVCFACTAMKSERTAEQLSLLLNGKLEVGHVLRRHDRFPTKELACITRADGQLVPCEVQDRSVSGVSLKTDVRLPIGEYVLIGPAAGRITRHHDEGVGIEFVGQSQGAVSEQPIANIALAS
jgi:hypothetical protein